MRQPNIRTFIRSISFTLVLASVGVGCGSSSSVSAPKEADLSALKCKPVANSGLGTGDVCVDSGLRSSSLFSFANWGGRRYKADDFGFPEMIALYGEDIVCGKSGNTKCNVTPKARMMRNVIDTMLQNGRCEGMTALGAMYMTSRGPDPAKFKAAGIQSLTPAVDDFGNILDYWWGTQFLKNVVDQSQASRKKSITSILGQIVNGLAEKQGVTVGLYAKEGAHSVLPVAVTQSSQNVYVVHVWDSNNPHALGRIQFDLSKETWTYVGGRINTSTTSTQWTGTNGTIDAVTLGSRNGSPLMNLDSGERGNATITASSSSARNISLQVTASDGKKLIASTTGTTGAIPGAVVTPMRNGDANQLVVSLPVEMTKYSVEVISSQVSASGKSDATQLTLENGTARAVSVSLSAGKGTTSAIVESTTNSSGRQSYTTSSAQPTIVTASTELSILNIPVQSKEAVTVAESNAANTDAVISIDPSQGTAQTIKVANPANGNAQDVVIARSSDGGLLAVTNPLTAVNINRDSLETITSSSAKNTVLNAEAAPASSALETVVVTNTAGAASDSAVSISSRISSDTDVNAWVEYGFEDNWNETLKTQPQVVKSGIAVNVKTSLNKLISGTAYRFRTVVEVDGTGVYSPYSTFVTTGTAPDELNSIVTDDSIKVSSEIVASTATGGVISSRITTPVASTAWIEYSLASRHGDVLKTSPQDLRKGSNVSLLSVLNGLSIGQEYRFRVVVNAKGVIGASAIVQFTTGSTVATETISTSTVGAKVSYTVGDIQASSANVNAVITSSTAGRAVAELSSGDLAKSVQTKAVTFAAGSNVKLTIPLASLQPSVQYRIRLIVTVGTLTQYGQYQTFRTDDSTSTTVIDQRFGSVDIPASSMREEQVTVKVAVDSADSGNVYFEYSVANTSAALVETAKTAVKGGQPTTVVIDTNPTLRAGTPYRVRAVLDTGKTFYRSAFSQFTTPGALNVDNYKASTPNLQRSNDGAAVTWSVGVPDVPSAISYKVLEGSNVLCSTAATTFQCNAVISSFGTHTIVVATFFNGVEITRSNAATITIGGTPTISAFSFVSATSTSLAFTYSFNPQGETVQYGIEIRTLQDILVRPDLGGQTSVAQNGLTQQVSGLSPSTTYKARLILMYGSQVISSAWVTVATQ